MNDVSTIRRIFIDTEFTTLEPERRQLISLGAVADTGDTEFYAEVPFDTSLCSDFTRAIVLPKLGRIPGCTMTRNEAGHALLAWLAHVRGPFDWVEICYDFTGDWELMRELINSQVPGWMAYQNVYRLRRDLLLEQYFMEAAIDNRPDEDHHALYDARALRHACGSAENI
jgi:hypothetical protein